MPVLCVRSRDRTEDQRIGRRSVTQRCRPSNIHLPTRHASPSRARKIILLQRFYRVREKNLWRIRFHEAKYNGKGERERRKIVEYFFQRIRRENMVSFIEKIFQEWFLQILEEFRSFKTSNRCSVSLLARAVGSSCEYNSRYLGEHAFPPSRARRGQRTVPR